MATYLEQQKQLSQGASADVAARAQDGPALSAADQKAQDTYGSMFEQYYVSRHDQDGHMYTADGDGLSSTQRAEMAYYSQRRIREQDMRNKGVSEPDIAMLRSWDEDIAKAQATGKQVDINNVLSADYAAQAQQKYNYDEAMYNQYVATSRQLSKEEWDPDGDGVFNVVDDVLKEYKDYNNEDIANSFDWMTADAKRGLAFDGVHNRQEYVDYMKGKIKEYDDAHSGFGYELGQFFKGIGHGIVSGLMDLVKLPTTIISLGAALFTGGFDNPVSKAMGTANKWVDDNITGGYDKIVGFDKDSTWGKVGSWAGQAVEIAAETLLTAGIGTAVQFGAKGVVKVGEKLAEKGTEKALEKGTEKVMTKAGASIATRAGARNIEAAAIKIAAKQGTKRVTEEHILQATEKVMGNSISKIGEHTGSKTFEKIVQDSASAATVRLARRGAYKAEAKGIEKLGESAAEKGITRVTKGVVEKAAEKAAIKEAKKAGEKVVSRQVEKKSAMGVGKRIASKIKNKVTGKATTVSLLRKGTQEHLVTSMASKGNTVIGKTLRTAFGKKDPLTRLFALKSFAGQVQQSQQEGDTPFAALARATLAYGTTNMIWGGLSATGSNAIKRMVTRNLGTKKFEQVVSSKLAATMMKNSGAILSVTAKMWADGTIHDMINKGMRTNEDTGKFELGIMSTIKENVSIEKIGKDFVTALTMHVTGGALGAGKKVIGKGVAKLPFIRDKYHAEAMTALDSMLDNGNTGLGSDIWNRYKDRAREIEGKDAKDSKIIDTAASLAKAEEGDVGEMINKFYVESNAKAYGGALRSNMEDIAEHIDEKQKSVNSGIKEKIKSFAGEDYKLNLNDKFYQQFSQYAIMNNINQFEGAEIPDDISVNNWSPEDFALGYARFQPSGIDVTKADPEEIHTAMHKAFDEVEQIKSKLGDNIDVLINRPFTQITKLTDMLTDPAREESTKKWIKFEKTIKQLFTDKKATEENIKDAIDRYKIKLEDANIKQSEGVIVDDVKDVIKTKEDNQKKEFDDAVATESGHKEFIDKRVNAVPVDPVGSMEEIDTMFGDGKIKIEDAKKLSADLYDAFEAKDSKLIKSPKMSDAKKYSDLRKADSKYKDTVEKLEEYKQKVEARRSTMIDHDELTGQESITESKISLREAADLKVLKSAATSAESNIIKQTITTWDKSDFKDVTGHPFEDAEIKKHNDLMNEVDKLIQTTKDDKIHSKAQEFAEDARDAARLNTRSIQEMNSKMDQIVEAMSKPDATPEEKSDGAQQIAELQQQVKTLTDEKNQLIVYKAEKQIVYDAVVSPIGIDYVPLPEDSVPSDQDIVDGEVKELDSKEPKQLENKKPAIKKSKADKAKEEYDALMKKLVDDTDPSCK